MAMRAECQRTHPVDDLDLYRIYENYDFMTIILTTSTRFGSQQLMRAHTEPHSPSSCL